MKNFILINFLLTLYNGAIAQYYQPVNPNIAAVQPFSEQKAWVLKNQNKKEQWYIWHLGESTHRGVYYDKALPYREGYAAVQEAGKWKFIDTAGGTMGGKLARYDEVHSFSNGRAAVLKKGKGWGFINAAFEQVIDFKYRRVDDFSEGRCNVVAANKDHQMITIERVVVKSFDRLGQLSDGLAPIGNLEGTRFRYVDSNGVPQIPMYQDRDKKEIKQGKKQGYAGNFSHGLAAVSTDVESELLQYINKKGVRQFSFSGGFYNHPNEDFCKVYRLLHQFSEERAAIKDGDQWRFIDIHGKYLTKDVSYDAVTPFSQGIAAVRQGSEWFFIDKTGTIIRKDNYSDAKPCTDGVAWVKKEGVWGMVRLLEKPIVTKIDAPNMSRVPSITLKAMIKSPTRLTDITIFVNDMSILAATPHNFNLEKEISLQQGENIVSVQVQNIGGITKSLRHKIIYTPINIKDSLNSLLGLYKTHIDLLIAPDTEDKHKELLAANLSKLFHKDALIYSNVPYKDTKRLSVKDYCDALLVIDSARIDLDSNHTRYCRHENDFFIHISQKYVGQYKDQNAEFKFIPFKAEPIFLTIRIVQNEAGNFYIMNILKSKSESPHERLELADDDEDDIPNSCDKCPSIIGSLDHYGADPKRTCPDTKPK